MGDITPVKILIVAVIALLVLGPEKLPEMTRKAGKAWAEFKSFRANMEAQVRETVGDVPGFSELSKLSKLSNVGIKSTIASTVSSAMSMPTSAGSSGAPAAPAPPSASGATSSSAAVASVSSGPEMSVAAAPSLEAALQANGSGSADASVQSRPGQGRVSGSSWAPTGGPVFAADDPSFN